MASSLGASGISLYPGQWEGGLSYRFLRSEDVFVGSEEQPDARRRGVAPRLAIHSFDLGLRYGVSTRVTGALVVPLVTSFHDVIHPDGARHTFQPRVQLGDLRLGLNGWIFDPLEHARGNLGLGLGVKVPTGNEGTTGTFFTPTGTETRARDISQQPGDGGWGVLAEWQGFYALQGGLTAYGTGFYLFNPRNTNGVEPPQSVASSGEPFFMSVPDQFSVRVGVAYPIAPVRGLSLSLGGRWDGMPVRDVFGGSDGFRRPGSAVFVEPGVTLDVQASPLDPTGTTLFVSVPWALRREIRTSVLDEQRGIRTGGGMARFVILAGVARRF